MESCKKVYRSRTSKIFGGVCGGISKYWGIYWGLDPFAIRMIIMILCVLFFGFIPLFILTYVILWLIVPLEPKSENHINNEN